LSLTCLPCLPVLSERQIGPAQAGAEIGQKGAFFKGLACRPGLGEETSKKEGRHNLSWKELYGLEIRHAVRHRVFLLVLIVVVCLLSSLLYSFLTAPSPHYVSRCTLLFEKRPLLPSSLSSGPLLQGEEYLFSQVSVIRSPGLILDALAALGEIPEAPSRGNGRLDPGSALRAEELLSRLSVKADPRGSTLGIEVTADDPRRSRNMAEALVRAYLRHREKTAKSSLQKSLEAIEKQIEEVSLEVKKARESLESYLLENGVFDPELRGKSLSRERERIREKSRGLLLEKQRLQAVLSRLQVFTRHLEPPSVDFHTDKAGPEYAKLNRTLLALLKERAKALGNPPIPKRSKLERKIKAISQKMTNLLSRRIRGMEDEIKGLQEKESELSFELESLLKRRLEVEGLKLELKGRRETLLLLEKKKVEMLAGGSGDDWSVKILQPPSLPREPVSTPNHAAAGILGAMAGLVIGLATIFFLEHFSFPYRILEATEKALKIPVLGVIPRAGSLPDHPGEMGERSRGAPDLRSYLADHLSRDSQVAESFRALQVNVLQGGKGIKKTLLVTSASSGEGKTFTAVNLALVSAQAGIKTLLVDADLRRPRIARLFGIKEEPGLSDALLGAIHWRDARRTVTDLLMGSLTPDDLIRVRGLDHLDLLTAGRPVSNPIGLFQSGPLGTLMKEIQDSYDLVILDTPVCLSSAEVFLLGDIADEVLLVHGIGVTAGRLLKRASRVLGRAECPPLGLVLNGIRERLGSWNGNWRVTKPPFPSEPGEESLRKRKEDATREKDRTVPLKGDGSLLGALPSPRTPHLIVGLFFLGIGLLWLGGQLDHTPVPNDSLSSNPAAFREKQEIDKTHPSETDKAGLTLKSSGTSTESLPALPPVTASSSAPSASREKAKNPPKVQTLPMAKEKTPSPPISSSPPSLLPYSLYLGSFKTLKRAEKAVSIYSRKGLSPYWTRVYFKEKGWWYRVYAGTFRDRMEAEAVLNGLDLKEAEIKMTRYANLVGEYSDAGELKDRMDQLRKLGYCPYTLPEPGNRTRLYVGAYLTRIGAERQKRRLRADGIESRVVERYTRRGFVERTVLP